MVHIRRFLFFSRSCAIGCRIKVDGLLTPGIVFEAMSGAERLTFIPSTASKGEARRGIDCHQWDNSVPCRASFFEAMSSAERLTILYTAIACTTSAFHLGMNNKISHIDLGSNLKMYTYGINLYNGLQDQKLIVSYAKHDVKGHARHGTDRHL